MAARPKSITQFGHDLAKPRTCCAMLLIGLAAIKMIKGGRWAVAITTGHGPVSYVGNFATEAEAQDWISTNAKDWPQPADKPR
jgi:hypothetical protein